MREFAEHQPRAVLAPEADNLLSDSNPLTKPSPESFGLLQLFVFSSHVLQQLQQHFSVAEVARIALFADEAEQLNLLERILHASAQGRRKDEVEWERIRAWISLLCNKEAADGHVQAGMLHRVDVRTVQVKVLETLLGAGCKFSNLRHHANVHGLRTFAGYGLVKKTYVDPSKQEQPLPDFELQDTVINTALQLYDSANHGNRSRAGPMKKASDM